MELQRPIILIEDDRDDSDTIRSAIAELGVANAVRSFEKAGDAYDYLLETTDKPLIILCDIRMGFLDGLSFRKNIRQNEYLRKKSIPFVFLSAMVSEEIVNQAYALDIQGFFDKPGTYQELKDHLLSILVYWQRAHHPK